MSNEATVNPRTPSKAEETEARRRDPELDLSKIERASFPPDFLAPF